MKIALVNNAWRGTGVGRYMFELFLKFKKMKKDVEMIYLQNREPFGLDDKKIKNITTPWKLPIARAVINNYYYFPKKIPEGYDVYHISNQTIAKCCGSVNSSILSCMDIFSYALKGAYDHFTNFFLKKHLSYAIKAKKIISISENTKQDMIKFLDIPEDRIKVIHLAINRERFKPRDKLSIRKKYNLPANQKIVLHVGLDEPRKNIPVLIKSFYKLKKKLPNVKLVRVGPSTKKIREMIQRMGLEKDIVHLDIHTSEIHLIYNAADLFVFPSYYEGFGLPVLEAMASGLPVIASNATSIPEIIGDAGSIVDPLDIDGFADSMYKILTEDDLHKDNVKKCLERAKKFSWEKTAKETYKIYEEVFKGV